MSKKTHIEKSQNSETDGITEEQVVLFLREKRRELQEVTRVDFACVQIGLGGSGEIECGGYVDGVGIRSAGSLETVIDELAEQSGPLHRARRARDEAAKLIAQAEILEAEAAAHV
jgi:hypothetical protein